MLKKEKESGSDIKKLEEKEQEFAPRLLHACPMPVGIRNALGCPAPMADWCLQKPDAIKGAIATANTTYAQAVTMVVSTTTPTEQLTQDVAWLDSEVGTLSAAHNEWKNNSFAEVLLGVDALTLASSPRWGPRRATQDMYALVFLDL